jgi:hypothetical protein
MQTGEIPLVPESLAALQQIFTAAQQQAAQMMAQAMQQGVPGQPGQPQMPQDPNEQPLPA